MIPVVSDLRAKLGRVAKGFFAGRRTGTPILGLGGDAETAMGILTSSLRCKVFYIAFGCISLYAAFSILGLEPVWMVVGLTLYVYLSTSASFMEVKYWSEFIKAPRSNYRYGVAAFFLDAFILSPTFVLIPYLTRFYSYWND